ncbi:hypothetical protein CXB51_020605 [Gossypium anomalum]|uniref:Hexosyltransferase n=1 Tax=Gossypium anomalum TaxID=47600 RepID=A0A8J6CTV6_9ROSI|nr:hypothetical protein CXB51_020605 [Gossypium anomalum]
MRGKAVSGKAILVLCLASFLAGSLITSRTWTSQSHNNNHPIVNHVTASNKLGEFDHKLRKLGEGKAEDIMGEVSKTHKAIQSLEKTISNLEMELAVSRMSSVGNGVTMQKPKSYSNHTLQKAFVVIGINTAFSSRKRRDSLRQTWMPTGHSATTGGVLDKALDKEEAEHKDFLRLNHVEGYHQLSTKTRLYFSTAVSMWDAEFYVKVDDDVHLNLAQYRSKPRVYIGCMKSGPVLSEKPILHRYANEDVSLGSWLIGLEVEHVDDRSMCCGTPPDCEWKAQAGNICVASFDWSCSGVCKSVEKMKYVHNSCGEGDSSIWKSDF